MHAPTALIIASFSTAAISVVFLLLWRATKGVDGPLHWFMGSGLLFVAGMLFFLRNLYPSDFTIVLANAVLTSGYLVLLWGVAKFVSQSLPWRIVGIAVALYAAAFAYFLWIEPGFVGRAVPVLFFMPFVTLPWRIICFAIAERRDGVRSSGRECSSLWRAPSCSPR